MRPHSMTAISAVVAAIGLGACTPAVYNTEALSIATAADGFTKSMPAKPDGTQPAAYEALQTNLLLSNEPLKYSLDCYEKTLSFSNKVVANSGQLESVQDATYQDGLKQLSVCELVDAKMPAPPLSRQHSDWIARAQR